MKNAKWDESGPALDKLVPGNEYVFLTLESKHSTENSDQYSVRADVLVCKYSGKILLIGSDVEQTHAEGVPIAE